MQGETGPLPWMHRDIPLHIWERKIALAVPTIGGTEQGEERGVLTNRQNLTVTECPAFGCKVERKNSYFSNEWVHVFSLCLGRENAEQRDDEVDTQIGLKVIMRLTASY